MTDRAPSPSVLVLDGLTRRYGSLTALDGVGLRLPAGARHAVIGPNGAGKTTLLNLIAGTERPDHGTIVLGGRDLTRTAPARRARCGIARSFQQPTAIGELTVLDNVVLAAWSHHPRRERVPAAREQLGAVGLDDMAHRPASELSHGRRRLLDLAVALVCRPRLLLLDEPAAGLTDRDIGRLLDVLGQLSGEVAMLLVEHHTGVVAHLADTVTVLKDGKALLTAPTDVALNHPDVREAYLGKGPDDMGPGDMGTDHVGPGDMGTDHVGPDDMGTDHVGPDDMGPDHVGPGEMGADQMGTGDMGPDHVGPDDMGADHTGTGGMGADHMGPDDVGVGPMETDHMGTDRPGKGTGPCSTSAG